VRRTGLEVNVFAAQILIHGRLCLSCSEWDRGGIMGRGVVRYSGRMGHGGSDSSTPIPVILILVVWQSYTPGAFSSTQLSLDRPSSNMCLYVLAHEG
jgi:hypothetical protein